MDYEHIDSLNVRVMSERWFEFEWYEWNEKRFFHSKDCYEEIIPYIPFQKGLIPENNIKSGKNQPMNIKKIFYTKDEIKRNQNIVYRHFGFGMKRYYFETIYVVIYWENRVERKWFNVANELLEKSDYLRYVKFCRCQNCLNKEKYNVLERFLIKYNPINNCYSDEPCLKHGQCTNDLLFKTRRGVEKYFPEYTIGNPIDKLSSIEKKKYFKYIQ